MELLEFLMMDADWFSYLVLPLLIFLARLLDVTLGTLRIIFVSRSMKILAPLVGFFESIIWLLAVSQIMQSLTNFWLYIAYAGGFSVGNYIGIYLEEKIAMGLLCVRTITKEDSKELVAYLKESNFGVTSISASGISGQVQLILSIIKRKDLPEMMRIVKEKSPKAFVSVEDIRSATEGYFPPRSDRLFFRLPMQRK